MIVLKGIAVFCLLFLLPYVFGSLFFKWTAKKKSSYAWKIVTGYLIMFTLFECLTVPMTILRVPYHILVFATAVLYIGLFLIGLRKCGRELITELKDGIHGLLKQPWTIYTAVCLVLIQIGAYVFFMTTDLDDAYYVAAATTAIHYDTLFLNSPYTGLPVDVLNLRYVLSPFPIFLAFLSSCTKIHPAVMAHTILPVALVSLAYLVYSMLGEKLFEDTKEPKRMTGLFLCLISLIHISSYYSVYTQGTFLLIRIWQGKAVLAAILLPCLFFLCWQAAVKEEKGSWLLIVLCAVSCTMVSSMGVALAPMMMGIFALLFGIFKKNRIYVGRMALCTLPCVTIGAIYLILKAVQRLM